MDPLGRTIAAVHPLLIASGLGDHAHRVGLLGSVRRPGTDSVPTADPATSVGGGPPVVERHWRDASDGSELGSACRQLVAWSIANGAGWTRNEGYTERNTPPRFLDNYAYIECVGPEAPTVHHDVRLGVLLLGPRTDYPGHAHPADEVYVSLAAGAWMAGIRWSTRAPGSVIHHPPGCIHAMRTGERPMAALYLWTGAIDTPAQLTNGSAASTTGSP